MLVYRAIDGGASPLMLGVLTSAFALPALLTAPLVGQLATRRGGSRTCLVGLSMLATGCLTSAVTPELGWLLLGAVIAGIGHLLISVGQQIYVAQRSDRNASDAGFASLSAASSIGQVIGPLLVTLVASTLLFGSAPNVSGTSAGLFVCAAVAGAALPLGLILGPHDAVHTLTREQITSTASYRSVLSTPQMKRALLAGTAVTVTLELMYTFVPIWAVERGIDPVAVGWLLALRALVSVTSRFGITRLIARFGRKVLMLTALSSGVIALVVLPMSDITGGVVAMVALGVCLGIPPPLTMAWLVQITKRNQHGAALGIRVSMNRLAQVSIPLAVSSTTASLGVAGVFWSNAALLTAAIAVIARSDPNQPPAGSA